MKSPLNEFYAFHEHAKSMTCVFSMMPKGPNPTHGAAMYPAARPGVKKAEGRKCRRAESSCNGPRALCVVVFK